jgi:hypothetical protein
MSIEKSVGKGIVMLPCPFCGFDASYDELICHPVWNQDDGGLAHPSQCCCPNCGCGVVGGETEQQAIERWNTRAA